MNTYRSKSKKKCKLVIGENNKNISINNLYYYKNTWKKNSAQYIIKGRQ